MSRRQRHILAPNLFPFLAVLVCTMGTLILLLAMLTQKGKEAAEQLAESHTEAATRQIEEERWRAEELQQLRARQTSELEKRRSELAHLEDHLRRLRQEMAELADEAEAANSHSDTSSQQAEARLVSLRTRIDEEKERLEELQEERDGRPPRVVIVPYQGSNGTDRRPIYVECTDKAVIIQPEGVRITAAHLEGPLGPGNPLDAALRAVRDHWQQADPKTPPPYPLLLVRPGGIHAYAACRVAMTAWDDQFGYELISEDLPLGFPEADAELHDKLVRTIREAARRQQTKIASMPRRYNSLSRDAIAASDIGRGPTASEFRGGGFHEGEFRDGQASSSIPENDSTATGHGSNRNPRGLTTSGDALGSGDGEGIASSRGTRNGRGRSGSDVPLGTAMPRAAGTPAGAELSGGNAMAAEIESMAGGTRGEGSDGSENLKGGEGFEGDGNFTTDLSGDLNSGSNGGSQGGQGPEGNVAADASNPLGGTGGTESRGQISGSGGSGSSSSGPPPAGMNVSANGSPSPSVSSPMQPAANDPHAKMFSEAAANPNFQADRRGSASDSPPELRAGNDWALPAEMSGGRGTAIVREMHLRCEADRFVLLPASRNSGAMTVVGVRNGDVDQAVTELAEVLRGRVESWGLAMQNGRWEPVLRVAVAAGGELRFEQLQALLRGSGIRVEREKP